MLKLYGRDDGGATSSPLFITLNNRTFTQESEELWNTFDDHGLVADIKRLPQESNDSYSLRIKDSYRASNGPSFLGVANSSSRELGIRRVDNAFVFTIPKSSTYNKNINSRISLEFGSTFLRINAEDMVIEETVYIDPVYATAKLSKYMREFPTSVVTEEGISVPLTKIKIDTNEVSPTDQLIYIDYPSVRGKFAKVRYAYAEELLYKTYPTLGQLFDAIKLLKDNTGRPLVNCRMDMRLSGGEDCLGLFISSFNIVGDDEGSVSWAPVHIRRISDPYFRDYFVAPGSSAKNSKFANYITELQSNSRTLWGSVQADRDFWDAADRSDQSFDHIPTLMDPVIESYKSYSGSRAVTVDSQQAWGRSYIGYRNEIIDNNGLDNSVFQAGVAHTNDLMPGIATFYNSTVISDPARQVVSDIKLNNNFIIFSGQR